MKRPSRIDHAAQFLVLLEDLRASLPTTGGDCLARLVKIIRPRRRESRKVTGTRLRTLVQVIESRPELAAALSSHVVAQLTSRMHRILYADSGMLTDQSLRACLARRVRGRLLPRRRIATTCAA